MGGVVQHESRADASPRPLASRRAMLGALLYLFLGPLLLFAAAGTVRWPMGWFYVALTLLLAIGSRVVVWRRNPDLLRERGRYASAEGAPGWDRVLSLGVGMVGPIVVGIVAGLHHRFGWPAVVPLGVQVLAAVLLAVNYGLGAWAMVSNPFFSAVVRLQGDRGHAVVAQGPYRWVRHPAYLGACIGILMLPLMLDALWALVPATLTAVAVVVRTALEDRFLRRNLPGYADYAQRTRYRLLPGLW